jgi:hypothetical protein
VTRASDLATAAIARPLLFAFWIFVLWGTLYGMALGYAIATEGRSALGRSLSGDVVRGVVNLIAAALAVLVWTTIGAAVLINRTAKEPR